MNSYLINFLHLNFKLLFLRLLLLESLGKLLELLLVVFLFVLVVQSCIILKSIL